MNLKWKLKKSEHLVQDEWIDFRKEVYELPDGSEFGPFYNYSRRNFVVIVARTKEDKYIIVKQFRHGIKKITRELCAGGIEEHEDPLQAAKRELQEETGYTSTHWTHLMTTYSNPTLADNYAHLYFADGCEKVSDLHLDATEFLEIEEITKEELENLIQNQKFEQPIHILAWLMVQKSVE